MPEQNTGMGDYMDSIGGAGITAARLESKRLAQKLEDERVRAEQDRIRARNRKSQEDAAARAEKADAEKRQKLQDEADAIVRAQNEAEREQAAREWRGVVGSMDGFAEYWKATANERAAQKIRERNANVPTARQVSRGEIGPRATFTPMDLPS